VRSAKNLKPGDMLQSLQSSASNIEWITALVIGVEPFTDRSVGNLAKATVTVFTDECKLRHYTDYECKSTMMAFNA